MDHRIDSKPLERNDRADVREGWCFSRHRIAVPEPVFVQEMSQVARARFGDELDQLTSQTQVSIEEEISDPVRWSAQSNYHARGCPACAKDSLSDGITTPEAQGQTRPRQVRKRLLLTEGAPRGR